VDVYVLAPTLIWVSPWKILGAKYGAYISPTFSNSSVVWRELRLGRLQQTCILRIVDHVGERPTFHVGVHPGLNRREPSGPVDGA
jgi:hypothetical protein